MTPAERDRYLRLLALPAAPPSHEALSALVRAHLSRFPFENVTKLRRAGRGLPPGLPTLDEFLGDHERLGTGGTCYVLASHFNALLRALGYDACLAGADMTEPDMHLVNVVAIESRPHLVDVGYAAPFFAPLPLDARDRVVVSHGDDVYALHPRDASGRHRVEQLRDGEVVHGYAVNPRPRPLDDFAGVIADSFRPEAHFMNLLRVVRLAPTGSIALRDFSATLVDAAGAHRSRAFADRDQLIAFAAAELGVAPAATAEACAVLAARGVPGFV